METMQPFNLLKWVEENRDKLKPPVGNETVYRGNQDFIVMVVGGPNSRKDYHIDRGEELFYQLEGTITVKVQKPDGSFADLNLGPGDMMLLPPNVPHSPRRGAGTVGLVIERYRDENEEDGFVWFCESCNHELYRTYMPVKDIVKDLPLVMNAFFADAMLRTCKNCGTVMEKPAA